MVILSLGLGCTSETLWFIPGGHSEAGLGSVPGGHSEAGVDSVRHLFKRTSKWPLSPGGPTILPVFSGKAV